MKVEECMNKEAITINANASVIDALKMIAEHKVSSLPVVDENNCLAGYVSKENIAAADKEDFEKSTIEQVMNEKVISVKSEDLLKTALDHMLNDNVNRLPVISNNKLVGIVTRDDVINYFYGCE